MPRVSVIINCRNGEPFLATAIQSVQQQQYPDLELIFWDNLSTDRSAEIAVSLGAPVRYFRSVRPLPLGEARNAAITQATGKYVALLDVDDYWLPGKLAAQVALLERRSELGLVYTDMHRTDGTNLALSRWSDERTFHRGRVFESLLRGCFISISTVVARCDAVKAVGLFDPRFRQVEDWDLWLRIAERYDIDYVPDVLVCERLHAAQESRKYDEVADEVAVLMSELRIRRPDLSAVCDEQMTISRFKQYGIRCYQALCHGQWTTAARSAARCLRLLGQQPIELSRGLRPWLTPSNRRMFLARY
jgi:glycosyltransferase involved in cell wall biosynthesis